MKRMPAIAFALGCIIGCAPKGGQNAPGAQTRTNAGFVDAGNGVQLFYRILGEGEDTVVVLHGGPGFTMDYFLQDLAPLGSRHTLLFYDQRGAGGSTLITDSASLTAQRFADDLEAVRRHFGIGRLRLIGHSWGAAIAALYAIQYPSHVDKMIIVDGIPLRRTELTRTFDQLEAARDPAKRRLMREWRERRLAAPGELEPCRSYYVLWFEPFFADPSAAQRSKGDFCAGTTESRANKVRSVDRFTFASLGDYDWRVVFRTVSVETLVVHGEVDVIPLETAREWVQALPNARLEVIDGVGHFPYLERPAQFFRIVDEFLRN